MKRTGVLTKVLAWLGTALVVIPVLAPFALARWGAIGTPAFHLDWLMPGELALMVVAGAVALLVASARAQCRRALVAWGVGTALVGFIALSVIATVTGLASGAAEPAGWRLWLVLGAYGVYVAAVLELAVAGVMLLLDIHRPSESRSPILPAA